MRRYRKYVVYSNLNDENLLYTYLNHGAVAEFKVINGFPTFIKDITIIQAKGINLEILDIEYTWYDLVNIRDRHKDISIQPFRKCTWYKSLDNKTIIRINEGASYLSINENLELDGGFAKKLDGSQYVWVNIWDLSFEPKWFKEGIEKLKKARW